MKRHLSYLYLVSLIVSFGCANTKDNSLEQALELSGKNRSELEKVLDFYEASKDNLKLEATQYLIKNMIHHGSYEPNKLYDEVCSKVEKERIKYMKKHPSSNPWEVRDYCLNQFHKIKSNTKNNEFEKSAWTSDLKGINSDFLIGNIEIAFEAWNKVPKQYRASKKDFFKYILPYRCQDEPLTSGRRKRLYHKYNWVLDALKAKPIDSIIKKIIIDLDVTSVWGNDDPFKTTPSIEQIENIHFGNCSSLCNYLVNILRSVGIPCGVDFTPRFGNYHKSIGHSWVFYLKGNDFEAVNIGLGDKHETLREIYKKSSLTKTYRLSFDTMDDITSKYKKTYNIDIPIVWKTNSIKIENVFLAIFDKYLGWDKIQRADELSSESAHFKDIGSNVIYMLGEFNENLFVPLNNPFELDTHGSISFFDPTNSELLNTVLLTRKYPPFFVRDKKMKLDWAQSLRGCKIQGSYTDLNKDYIDILTFTSYNSLNQQKIIFPKTYKYNYYRLKSSENKNINLSQFLLIDQNEMPVYNWNRVFTNNNMDSSVSKLTDTFPLTFVEKKGLTMTYYFNKPKSIKGVIIQTRNDDNNVAIGDTYELMLWDKDWVSMGLKKANDTLLTYNELPKNGLYWLKNRTKGSEEFVFSFTETGNQFWTGVSEFEIVDLE